MDPSDPLVYLFSEKYFSFLLEQALCCALVLVLVVVFIVILVIYRWVSAALRQTLTRASVANMSEDKL
jgi:predicted RND superfamily exporter protein